MIADVTTVVVIITIISDVLMLSLRHVQGTL